MSELLEQAMKDQSKEILKKSLQSRIDQYEQVRNLAQAHALVLEKCGDTTSKDWLDCQVTLKDSIVKIAAARAVMDEAK